MKGTKSGVTFDYLGKLNTSFMAVEIREVLDKAELKKFVQFNIDLYRNNPYHVPGLIDD